MPDRYRIISELGSGGMGTVYKARDLVLNRLVAIKVIHQDKQSLDDNQIVRFQREAQACGNLKNDALVTVYDFGVNDNREPYLVMELLEGTNLSDYIEKEGRLSPQMVYRIACQLADAMIYAHNHGVIHRDLKSSNLVFFEDESGTDRIKVIDFGLVKFVKDTGSDGHLTQANSIIGSPQYVSPEQIEGTSVDERADIYSLGCILFESLTGRLPFHSDSLMELLLLKADSDGPKPSSLLESNSIPQVLDELVAKCLKVDPDQRFSSMEVLRKELEKMEALVSEYNIGHSSGIDDSVIVTEHFQKKIGMIEIISFFALLIVCSSLVVSFIDPFKIKQVSDQSTSSLPSHKAAEKGDDSEKEDEPSYFPRNIVIPKGLATVDGLRLIPMLNDTYKVKIYGDIDEKKWKEIEGKNVTRLHLNNCDLTDSNVSIILTLPVVNLEIVDCTGPSSVLKKLAESKTIHTLNFRRTSIEDKDLVPLENLNLKELHLTHCPRITNTGLGIVSKQWPNLEILHITGRNTNSFRYNVFSKLKKLNQLNVVVSNENQVEDISQIKSLTYLRISESKLNNNILKKLGNMKHLTMLQLDYCTSINKYQLALLKHMLPACNVTLRLRPGVQDMRFPDMEL